nr:hypothetical protein [Pantoea agglomerans]
MTLTHVVLASPAPEKPFFACGGMLACLAAFSFHAASVPLPWISRQVCRELRELIDPLAKEGWFLRIDDLEFGTYAQPWRQKDPGIRGCFFYDYACYRGNLFYNQDRPAAPAERDKSKSYSIPHCTALWRFFLP